MDKCTHEVRKQRWMNIIQQCMQRPEGISVKQWCDNNGICEQTYYVWLKKIRQEAYSLVTTSSSAPAVARNEVTFAEVTVPSAAGSVVNQAFQTAMIIHSGSVTIEISNTISETLLTKLLEVVAHA